jgi:hypothetical protein
MLCSKEAVVWVSPTVSEVTAAHKVKSDIFTRSKFIIPIREQPVTYLDARTGKEFYTFKAFHTPGGWVMRSGLNLGHSTSCWPEDWISKHNEIDIDAMLEKGKHIEPNYVDK